MFSWLHPKRQKLQQQQRDKKYNYACSSSSSSLPLAEKEKVMITPKSIAIAKKTAVYASDVDTYYNYQPQQDNSSIATCSAASLLLSANLVKNQQQEQHHKRIQSDTDFTYDHASPHTSVASLKSSLSCSSASTGSTVTRTPSSSPPPPSLVSATVASPRVLQNVSSASGTSSLAPVIYASSKTNASLLSTGVSANGDIVFETHILEPASPFIMPSTSSLVQQQERQPNAMKNTAITTTGDAVSMVSISLAEKRLMQMIHPLPPPMSSSVDVKEAIQKVPDLEHHRRQDAQSSKKRQEEQQMDRSFDQHSINDFSASSTAPQLLEKASSSSQQEGFWSWLFPSHYSTLTNQDRPVPSFGNGHRVTELDKKTNNSIRSSSTDDHTDHIASMAWPMFLPATVSAPSVISSSSSSLSSSAVSSSVQPVINVRKAGQKNYVLPLFGSQYRVPPSPSPSPTSTSTSCSSPSPTTASTGIKVSAGKLFDKAIESINQFIQQASSLNSSKPADSVIITDPDSWKQQIKARFARFIDDMKSDPYGLAGKKVVVVGVHGWFPMKLVRSMIGEPTGTSVKFCEQMVAAVKKYFEQEHGLYISEDTTTITSIPLEGEGKVEDRVNKLYATLINHSAWLEAISSADVILWATHSQGTPVSVLLMHRLLERGHIHTHRQSVVMCCMAGVSHGPFPVLKGSLIVKYFEADAARELFEFMDSESDISQKYRSSLTYVMERGIKLTLVGSMQDQVVPLYSAIISAISHPNIVRAVYIDGHVVTQENKFIIQLITFALGLRNAGISDHGLLTHLSEVLAGSLYALEGGHSTIYEELDVYYLAVQQLFETDPLGKAILIHNHHHFQRRDDINTVPSGRKKCDSSVVSDSDNSTRAQSVKAVKLHPFQAKHIKNPYYLPWALRGICEDPSILQNEVWLDELNKLRQTFDQWEPASPKLRSLKVRLEPFTLPLV